MALAIGATFDVKTKSDGGADVRAEAKVEAEEKAAPKPRAAKKAEEPKQEPSAGNADEKSPAKDQAASKSAAGPADFAVEGVDPSNKDSVRAYLSQSIDILGGPAVTEVFGEFGATKFGEVKPEQYEALVVRLAELRALKESEAA